MKRALYFLGCVLIFFAIFVTFFSPSTDLISPLSNSPPLENRDTGKPGYLVLGFAPYWNLKKISPESMNHLTHLAYFNLHLKGDGSLFTKVNRKEEDPGYTNYKRLISHYFDYPVKPLIITFMPESQAALTSIISTPSSRNKTISTVMNTIIESSATGVNIDFEPLGDNSQLQRDNFTLFIQELRTQLDKLNGASKLLTISTYASSASRPRIWDLAALSKVTDYFVIMTYDYTMPGSLSAGPNSPLRGSGQLFEHDIVKNISEISKLVPVKKILLGIPFYGYEWNTIDDSKYSPTEAKGSVASLERIQKMLDDKTLDLLWDRNSLTPYAISTSSGQISQIYFENETSIRLKLEFVKSAGLGGIAIWALGYEGNNSWVWPTIQQLNK